MADRAETLDLIVCAHFQQEVKTILQVEGFEDVHLLTFSPVCSNPQLAKVALKQLGKIDRKPGNKVLLGACFSTSPKQLSQAMPDSKVIHFEQCFHMLVGRNLIDEYLKTGAYLLTPGWLANWRAHLEDFGLDQATARSFFGECATRLVLLDTGIDPQVNEKLADFAGYINLPAQVVPIGLDYFRLTLAQVILEWRLENIHSDKKSVSEQSVRKIIADQAMVFDLLASLTSKKTEAEVIQQILDMFAMLVAPGQMTYAAVDNGRVESTYAFHDQPPESGICQAWLDQGRKDGVWSEAECGFYLQFSNQEQILGLLEIKDIAFPNFQQEYLPLTATLAKLCGLAIKNARLFQEVQKLAYTDSLTGLNNRRFFFSGAEIEFARAQRYARPLSAIMLDIDDFKKFNDTYGHALGDRVLAEVAQCCQRELRLTDLQGRYGGEEFVFLLPETTLADALFVAERLCQKIADLVILGEGQRLHVTVSLGLACMEAGCTSLEGLLEQSDKALYLAKHNGRNRVCTWSNEHNLSC